MELFSNFIVYTSEKVFYNKNERMNSMKKNIWTVILVLLLISVVIILIKGVKPENNKEPNNSDKEIETNLQEPLTEEPDDTIPVETPENNDPEEEHICENEPIPMPESPEQGYVYKPVIYLYPEKTTEISVELDYNGVLTTTYPKYIDGWKVVAEPDGTISYNGREYYCLFWEGISNIDYSLEKGFCVKGEDTEKFLEDSLKKLGLTDKEANEFIIYWLPKMENNEYNIISFQEKLYTDNAKLTVSPAPDTVIRVFMAWKGSDEFVEIEPQNLTAPERIGFTVVEWGGSELK